MEKFRGLFPALITPFKEDGSINGEALCQIMKLNLAKGVKGFYVGGSTAEAFLLSIEERKEILEIVVNEARGLCAIISHVGCMSTDRAIELAKHANELGVDAISSIPPFYYKFSFEEIKRYYQDIMDTVETPMIIYNFPAFSGVSFSSENSKELFDDPMVLGVKHTSYDLFQMDRMKQEHEGLLLFNGHDEVFLGGLSMGADGAIGSTYNFMAHTYLEIQRLYYGGDPMAAKELQSKANAMIATLERVGVIQGIKYILSLQGMDCGHCRRPFKRLDDKEKALLQRAIGCNP